MTREEFSAWSRSCHVADAERFADRCETLRVLLKDANERVNLTRLTSPEDFFVKHAADSLLLVREFQELAEARLRVADIGCGAGFPTLILALAFPQLLLTAIDSTGKKTEFVRSAANELGLTNVRVVHGRAVELNRKEEFRHRFDVVTARAVADSPRLWRECSDFPCRSGRFLFYKTPEQADQELPQLASSTPLHWHRTEPCQLPDSAGTRCFVWAEAKKDCMA